MSNLKEMWSYNKWPDVDINGKVINNLNEGIDVSATEYSAEPDVGYMHDYTEVDDVEITSDFSKKPIKDFSIALYDPESGNVATISEWIEAFTVEEYEFGTPGYDEAFNKMLDDWRWTDEEDRKETYEILQKNSKDATILELQNWPEQKYSVFALKNMSLVKLSDKDLLDDLCDFGLERVPDDLNDEFFDQFIDNEPDWDSMPGGHDYY